MPSITRHDRPLPIPRQDPWVGVTASRISRYAAVSGFLIALVLVGGLAVLFEPLWATADDLQMSMIAHGYGSFQGESPNLVFSNVVWGLVVERIPPVAGILGYSWASMTALFVVAWAILSSLFRLGVGPVAGVLAVLLIMARPVVFPQFTVTAGLLVAAAILGAKAYASKDSPFTLLACFLLALWGWLLRTSEFYLVLGVCLPLVPWKTLSSRWPARLGLLAILALMVLASALDRAAYTGPEWTRFLELNGPRIAFTDYGAASLLKSRPEVLERHAYSTNDLDLFSDFFLADPTIAAPSSLREMLGELGPLATRTGGLAGGVNALRRLRYTTLLPMLVFGLCLALLYPRTRVFLAWALLLAATFWIGMSGRVLGNSPLTSLTRVLTPPVALLCVMPLVYDNRSRFRGYVAIALLAAACTWELGQLSREQSVSQRAVRETKAGLSGIPFGALPDDVLVRAWGGDFFIEQAYPVLDRDAHLRDLRFMTLGIFSFAPTSVSMHEERSGRGFITRLRGPDGAVFVVSYRNWRKLDRLAVYCQEHYGGRLDTSSPHSSSRVYLVRARCVTP